jgi:hypothetical protein
LGRLHEITSAQCASVPSQGVEVVPVIDDRRSNTAPFEHGPSVSEPDPDTTPPTVAVIVLSVIRADL